MGVSWKPYPDKDESYHQRERLVDKINGLSRSNLTATVTATPT